VNERLSVGGELRIQRPGDSIHDHVNRVCLKEADVAIFIGVAVEDGAWSYRRGVWNRRTRQR
jgi:hypothetical protein